ncbi:acyl-CoA carboxylase epsilon subunit [Nocardioides sp.]|uniref:acyl-CoA carboxylase epsilon subunit n=1 Tax=Nocardioides sp. TaxID=35761 RepID=UPI003510FCD2
MSEDQKPLLRVVNPDATPEEVAAVVAVLSALGGGAPAPAPPRSQWAAPHRQVRRTLPHGAGAWRASGLPH